MHATAAVSSANRKPQPTDEAANVSVVGMVGELSVALESAIGEIHSVNSETKVLALNARIEAARAGTYGAAFSVVAEEMQQLSEKTSRIANEMANRTRDKTNELRELIGTTVKGTRLADIALTNIDLIDRNLYERTCDVRWWATDGSLVDALSTGSAEAYRFASQRMGVIVGAYTVYHDLVLCDRSGRVVANAKPSAYQNLGADQSQAPWYSQAMASRSGDEYGFQSAHRSELVRKEPALIYSCAVRKDGKSNGEVLGALGIVFDWAGLAGPIVSELPLAAVEASRTSAFIVNRDLQVLASNRSDEIGARLQFAGSERVFARNQGFFAAEFEGEECTFAHAKSPGFETYSTGWYSLLIQPTEDA